MEWLRCFMETDGARFVMEILTKKMVMFFVDSLDTLVLFK